jgi:imidazolonepropionase-like amidohydrolase
MNRRIYFFIAIILICAQTAFLETEPVTAIRCGKLLNPQNGSLTSQAVIVIQGERIVRIDSSVPEGSREIDLSAYTVLPGLIDCHTHVLLQPEDEGEIPPVITKSQSFRTVQGVAAVKKDLEAGFTTLRDLDSEGAGFADVAIRDAINKKIIPGPRLFVSTLALTITAGHMNINGLNPDITIPEPAALVDSRDAMIAELRRQVKYGADWIKLYATGTLRHVDEKTLEPVSQVSLEDVQAVVKEAQRWHRDVAAHAYGGDGAKNAVLGGVRSLEHGILLDEETLDLMVKNGTYWCPTLSAYFPARKEDDTDKLRRIIAHHKEVFQKAMKKGIKIAFGTDVGSFEHGTEARELEQMVKYGMSPIDTIRSATLRSAQLLRMEKEIGSIESGKFADIIAVQGNPLEDIQVFKKVVFVMKAGEVYKWEK